MKSCHSRGAAVAAGPSDHQSPYGLMHDIAYDPANNMVLVATPHRESAQRLASSDVAGTMRFVASDNVWAIDRRLIK